MTGHGPTLTVTALDAATSRAKRLELDIEHAAWFGMDHGEAVAFWGRLDTFDVRTPAWEARCALAEVIEVEDLRRRVEDSRPAMLARVNAVIADLVEQLVEDGIFPLAEHRERRGGVS